MSKTNSPAIPYWLTLGLTLALLLITGFARAADAPSERGELAAALRQLDMLDRLAANGANLPPQDQSRYHFDYARLRADIARMQAGIRDYLSPQRAQPRDPEALSGTYRQDSGKDIPQ